MVIRHSVNDWYVNAEGAGDNHSSDWQNDDRPDRGPDSWLDRAMSSPRPGSAGRSPAGSASARRSTGSSASAVPSGPLPRHGSSRSTPARSLPVNPAPQSRVSTRSASPLAASSSNESFRRAVGDEELAAYVASLKASRAGMSAAVVAARARARGGRWATVSVEDVSRALAREQSASRTGNAQSASRTGKGKRRKALTAERVISGAPWSIFVRAVGSTSRNHPDPRPAPKAVARRLRELGWKNFAVMDVVNALAEARVHPDARPRPTTRPSADRRWQGTGNSRQPDAPRSVAPLRQDSGLPLQAPRPLAADICPSCGVRISSLGMCRCS